MVSLGVGSVFASFRLGGGGNLSKADRFDPTTLDSLKGLSSPSTGSDGVLVESFVRLVKQVGVVFRSFAECSCCSLSDMASEGCSRAPRTQSTLATSCPQPTKVKVVHNTVLLMLFVMRCHANALHTSVSFVRC